MYVFIQNMQICIYVCICVCECVYKRALSAFWLQKQILKKAANFCANKIRQQLKYASKKTHKMSRISWKVLRLLLCCYCSYMRIVVVIAYF